MAEALVDESDEKKTLAVEGRRARFKDREDSKAPVQSGSDGLSDMDSDELEELVD